MAKKDKEKVKKSKSDVAYFDPSLILADDLDDIARRMHINEGGGDPGIPMSTGMLAHDMILGGGIRPSWLTIAGKEQSAKTTSAITIMASGIKHGITINAFWDYEGSTAQSMPYVRSILKSGGVTHSMKEVFGEKDHKTGKWITAPLVRYSEQSVGEKFFNWMAALQKQLPDKRKIGEDWWFVYEDTKQNKARVGEYANSSMSKKYGSGLYVPAADGSLQALIIIDSLPAMNPKSADEKEEGDNSLALQARMFSKHLPRVKGEMSPKRIAVIAINQLRDAPMVMYGPKENEPGGQALKFNSDQRIRSTPRALSAAPFNPKPGKDMPDELEASVQYEDGADQYRYINIKAIKNKLGQPGRSAWVRIWVEDGNGIAKGFDPFFDTIQYLKETGQLIGNQRHKLMLNLHGLGESKKTVPWMSLKRWVLGSKQDMRDISEKYGFKPMSLRAFCFKQMKDGTAEKLYVEKKRSKSKTEDDDGDSE